MDINKQALLDLKPEELAEQLAAAGKPRFHAGQIMRWVYQRRAVAFDQMSDLSKAMRQEMADRYVIYPAEVSRRQESSDGTRKLLLAWPDGATAETVMIPERTRRTACLSTQAGCPVGCRFCASGLGGLQRNLTPGQIVEQALQLTTMLGPDERLTNIVFMGSGEPLANYRGTLGAIQRLNADWGLHVGARHITVSTVGLPKQIRQLADEGLQINLALSIHAPNDELRANLIPWAKGIALSDIVDAARYYFEQTGRELTFEYILLAGVNDQPRHAEQLAALARKVRCNVNLIRYNAVEGLPFQRPTAAAAQEFQARLRRLGVNSHLRASRGADIDAACGQLRRRTENQTKSQTPSTKSQTNSNQQGH